MKQEHMLLILVALSILFGAISFFTGNKEFLLYTTIILIGSIIIYLVKDSLRLTNADCWGMLLVLVLHALGGMLIFNGIRLYDTWFFILRYDNIVHIIGVYVVTTASYQAIKPYLKNVTPFGLMIILVLFGMGLGAFNEIVELVAVVFFNAAKGVGDYMNNALDLVFNFVGSIIAYLTIRLK